MNCMELFQRYLIGSLLSLLLLIAPLASSAESQTLSANHLAKLIRRTEPGVKNSRLWAKELTWVMNKHRFKRSRENCCAVIAIISQESGFVANPRVANMGKVATKAIMDKFGKLPLANRLLKKVLEKYPTPDNSYMKMLRNAKTERDLDRIYRNLISSYVRLMGPLRDIRKVRNLIENMNEIDTIGSMQVSVKFAVQTEEKWRKRKLTLDEIWGLREWMYMPRGGMWYGVLRLLGYKTGYTRKIHRFADFNAGRYASRNAAFQHTIATLLGSKLVRDGDLLIYGKNGNVRSSVVSNSERALNEVAKKYGLKLNADSIRADLRKEKTWDFRNTDTYKTICQQYRKVKRKRAPYAMIPRIDLNSEKTSRILTTEKFAQQVNKRYQRCIKIAKKIRP